MMIMPPGVAALASVSTNGPATGSNASRTLLPPVMVRSTLASDRAGCPYWLPNRSIAQFLEARLRCWQLGDIIVKTSVGIGDRDRLFSCVQNVEKIGNLIVTCSLVIDRYGHEILKHDETHCSLEAGVRANGDALRA